ncbi:MAG: HAD family hydrolase [Sphaerochaetaceae bacterium]|jgi:phosphoglycolate phosphatase
MKKEIKGVLFDLDGTLIDTVGDITYSFNALLKDLNIKQIDKEETKKYVGRGLANAIRALLKDKNYNYEESEFDSLLKVITETYATHPYESSSVYSGNIEFVQKCLDNNVKVGVLSNKDDNLTKIIINYFFPDTPFTMIQGYSKEFLAKPDPNQLIRFSKLCNCDVSEVLLIGDSDVDWQTAVNGKSQKAILTWGFKTKEQLIELGCEPLYDTITELEKELFKWN